MSDRKPGAERLLAVWLTLAAISLIPSDARIPRLPGLTALWIDGRFDESEAKEIEAAVAVWNGTSRRYFDADVFTIAGKFAGQGFWRTEEDVMLANGRHDIFRDSVIALMLTYDDEYVGLCVEDQDIAIRPEIVSDDPNEFRHVVIHELGHLLGLPHSDDATSIMYPEVGFNQIEPASTDIMLLCREYDCLPR